MRIAYLPTVSARNVQAAPSYQWFLALRRNTLALIPDAVFYVLVPKLEEGSGWQAGADWSGDRTHVVEVPMYRSQYDELQLMTRDLWEMFNERFGTHFFEVFLHERPQLNPLLKRVFSFHVEDKSRKPLVVARDQFTLSMDDTHCDLTDELLEVMGWATSPTLFQSDHQLRRAMRVARRHVTGSHLARIHGQSMVLPLGIDCADVDATNTAERGQKYDKITINYSHKLFSEQRYVESLAIMDSVFAGGRPVQLQIVTGSQASKMKMSKAAIPFQYINTFGGMGRREFLKQMARAHIFVSNSVYEDFSATVVEQLWTGLVPVLVDKPWSRYLLPGDYPYLFTDRLAGNAMLRYVVDNYYQVAAEWVPRIREKIRREFDLGSIVPQFVKWMREANADRVVNLRANRDGLRSLMDEVYDKLPVEFGEADVYEMVRATSRSVNPEREAESMSTSKWLCLDLMLMLHPELIDLGTEQPTWRKP